MTKVVALCCSLLALVAAALLAPSAAHAARNLHAADSLETAVVAKVNSVRMRYGLRPLSTKAPLERAATNHVGNMARHGYFGHKWSTGAPFASWIRGYWPGRSYRGSWSVGENLFWRGPTITADHVVQAWLHSPTHRANLLAAKWRSLGVGAVAMHNPNGRPYRAVSRATVVAAEFGVRN
jgi:uncharacterized protein YkwD